MIEHKYQYSPETGSRTRVFSTYRDPEAASTAVTRYVGQVYQVEKGWCANTTGHAPDKCRVYKKREAGVSLPRPPGRRPKVRVCLRLEPPRAAVKFSQPESERHGASLQPSGESRTRRPIRVFKLIKASDGRCDA